MENNVLYVSFDEHGDFENESISGDKRFIAGLIYESNKEDERIEKERIKNYFLSIMEDCDKEKGENEHKFIYPIDLHLADKNRKSNVKKVQNKIDESLAEFINYGTYKGEEIKNHNKKNETLEKRSGKYHLFAMIKSFDGKKKSTIKDVSKFVDDNYASSLYFHMTSSLIDRIISHNPLFKDRTKLNFSIDLPSRVTDYVKNLGDKASEYEAYSTNLSKGSSKEDILKQGRFSIANKDIYRTIISQSLTEARNKNIDIVHFDVKSLLYFGNGNGNELLYLSDILCSTLSRVVNKAVSLNGNKEDVVMNTLYEALNNLNNDNENLVYAYDKVDDFYHNAYSQYENEELFEALSTIYDASLVCKDSFGEFYKRHIFSKLKEDIINSVNIINFKKCVNNIEKNIMVNNLDQSKLVYLVENINIMKDKVIDLYAPDDKNRLLFELNNYTLSAYCHIGKPYEASMHYLECLKSEEYITSDKLIDIRRKYSECLSDTFLYEEANKIAKENKNYYDNLLVARENLLNNISKKEGFISKLFKANKPQFTKNYLEYAKTLSNLGRSYAYLRKPIAEREFKAALKMMNKEDANYKITESYLLHYYADNNMLDKFEIEATSYFGGNSSYKDRYDYIKKEIRNKSDLYSLSFMLYVYVRGLYLSKTKEVKAENINSLIQAIVDNKKNIGKNFPWPIIYKYVALLDKKNYEKYIKDIKKSSLDNGITVKAIVMYQCLEVYKEVKDKDKFKDTLIKLEDYLKENFIVFKDYDFESNPLNAYKQLNDYFTYMTR